MHWIIKYMAFKKKQNTHIAKRCVAMKRIQNQAQVNNNTAKRHPRKKKKKKQLDNNLLQEFIY